MDWERFEFEYHLYRSEATMNAITTELYETGEATDVFALTITRTRSNQ